jgi:hypothetical protein
MLKAGYYSFGPFELGDGHDTKKVADVLGDLGIAWVETSHFIDRLLGLAAAGAERQGGADSEKELAELKTVLPTVDPKTKMLSTWLRTHLLARRAEAIYDDVRRRLGAHDERVPVEEAGPDFKNYRGQGPYFGHRGKFIVLVFDRASSFARYARAFVATKQRFTIRHLFPGTDSMLFMTAEEFSDSQFRDDRALHCHLVFGLVHNLIDAYRHFNHELPVCSPRACPSGTSASSIRAMRAGARRPSSGPIGGRAPTGSSSCAAWCTRRAFPRRPRRCGGSTSSLPSSATAWCSGRGSTGC